MKHILATTAVLALSAGFAAAEVTLSGDARMGIISPFGDGDTGFTSRARVTFTLSGETDGGLSFGASFRADNAGGAASGTAGSVFVSTGPLKISMGDVDGAALAAVGHVDGVGLTGLGDLNELNFIGAGGANGNLMNQFFFNLSAASQATQVTGDPTLLLEYTAGSLSLYASATQPSHTYTDIALDVYDASAISFGAAYAAGAYKLSVGYEMYEQTGTSSGSARNLVLGADATFGAITMKARYSAGGSEYDISGDWQDHTQVAVSATYVADALSLTAFVSQIDFDSLVGNPDVERDVYGLGASYDLGGGAKVVGGYVKNDTADDSAFDLGLSFSF